MSSSFTNVVCPKCKAPVDTPCKVEGKREIVCGKRVRQSLIERNRT